MLISLGEASGSGIAGLVDGLDYPVGTPDGDGYTVSGWDYLDWNVVTGDYHTGEDWNGIFGGNTDWGDSVYAVANGIVVAADDYGPGWGNIIVIEHTFPDGTVVWSRSAHNDENYVSVGDEVKRGDLIGTIGRGYDYGNGLYDYTAHLHFDIMVSEQDPGDWVSGWLSGEVALVYADPSDFIEDNREVGEECEEEEVEVLADVLNPRQKSHSTYARTMHSDASTFYGVGGQTLSSTEGEWFAGDFDGDGFTDLANVIQEDSSTVRWDVYINNGSGSFGSGQTWKSDFGDDGDTWLVGDLNGDGLDDAALVRPRADSTVKLRATLSSGTDFQSGAIWLDSFGHEDGTFLVGDVDADGDDDVVMAYGLTPDTLQWQVAISSGASFNDGGVWKTDMGSRGDYPLVGDFDGDGDADIAVGKVDGEDKVKWKVAFSDGTSFGKGSYWKNDFGSTRCTFYAADLDGDGLDDLLYSRVDGAHVVKWRASMSSGSSFKKGSTWKSDFGDEGESFLIGEFYR